jgi:hypothetical protein
VSRAVRTERLIVLSTLLAALACSAHGRLPAAGAPFQGERRRLEALLVMRETSALEHSDQLWGRRFDGQAPLELLPRRDLELVEGTVESDGSTRIRAVGAPLYLDREGNRRIVALALGLDVLAPHLPAALLPEQEDDGPRLFQRDRGGPACRQRRCQPDAAAGDFEWPTPLSVQVRYRIELPDGFAVDTLPPALSIPLGLGSSATDQNNAAWALLCSGRLDPRALTWARRSTSTSKTAAAVHTLAAVLAASGELGETLATYETLRRQQLLARHLRGPAGARPGRRAPRPGRGRPRRLRPHPPPHQRYHRREQQLRAGPPTAGGAGCAVGAVRGANRLEGRS